MNINFFEEFPENLNKAKLIKFNALIFIAAKNIKEFNIYKNKLKKINSKLTAGYWPILKKSYWVSPFAYTKELKKLQNEIKSIKSPVLIDLELPFLDKKLFLINFSSFFKNKKIIKKILKNKNIITAEYPCPNKFVQKIYELLGISYNLKYKKIIMFYTSMIKSNKLKKSIAKIIKKQKPAVGLGTIAKGIFGNEPILSPDKLDNDLAFLKNNNIKSAYIFRLAGLNKEYLNIISKYI